MSLDEDSVSNDGQEPTPNAFTIEDLTVGAQSHGFRHTEDGRSFAFQVKRGGLRMEVYHGGLSSHVPPPKDVSSVAELSVNGLDLYDERSVAAVVRDAAAQAVKHERRPEQSTTIHAFLTRLGSVIDGI